MSETKDNLLSWRIEGRWWVRGDGLRLLVIQGGGPANTVQNNVYAFGDDDGSQSAHSLDTENTNRTAQEADVTFMIRIQVEETAGGTDNLTAALYAQKNGTGGFVAVPYSATNNGLRLANDVSSRTDDELLTPQRLSYGGSSGYSQGRYDDGTGAVGTSAVNLDQDTNGVTEFEFAILIDSANASDNDYWELRVEWTSGTDLDGYPVGNYPTVTADIGAAPQTVVLDTAPMAVTGVVSDTDVPQITEINTAAMTVTGVTSQVNQTVKLQSATLTVSGVAFEQIDQTIVLSSAAMTVAGVAGDIDAPISRTLNTATLTVTGAGATIDAPAPGQQVTLDTAAITASGVAFEQINRTVSLSSAALAVAGVGSSISAVGGPQTVILSSAALTATGVAAAINAPIAVLFDTAPMTLAGVLFSVDAGAGVTVELETA